MVYRALDGARYTSAHGADAGCVCRKILYKTSYGPKLGGAASQSAAAHRAYDGKGSWSAPRESNIKNSPQPFGCGEIGRAHV